MPQRDTTDFVAAFVIGTALGAGIALTLRSEPSKRTERLRRELQPYRRKARKHAARARKGFAAGAEATGELGGLLRDAGRGLLDELRQEMAEAVAEARAELARAARDEIAEVRNALKRRVKSSRS